MFVFIDMVGSFDVFIFFGLFPAFRIAGRRDGVCEAVARTFGGKGAMGFPAFSRMDGILRLELMPALLCTTRKRLAGSIFDK